MEQFGILALGSRMKRLSDYLYSEVQQIYTASGIPISATCFPVLRLLQKSGPLSVVEMAELLGISHPAVSKQVGRLLGEGMLEKEQDPRDQRRSLLLLSESGKEAMQMAEPVLQAIGESLEALAAGESSDFIGSFSLLETRLLGGSFCRAVLRRLSLAQFELVDFAAVSEQAQEAFGRLNMIWLTRYFPEQITGHDHAMLANPEKEILERGGTVWFARIKAEEPGLLEEDTRKQDIVGTVALLPVSGSGGEYEIAKLAVDPRFHRRGIAALLVEAVIETARKCGARQLSLETASCLDSAMRLYKRFGFIKKPPPRPPSAARVDIYMVRSVD